MLGSGAAASDPDLARVVQAGATLPDPIRRAVLALIGSADFWVQGVSVGAELRF